MPQGVRRWCGYWVPRYLESKPRASEGWKRNVGKLLCHLVADGRRGRSRIRTVPAILRRAGVGELPQSPAEVTAGHLEKLRGYAEGQFRPSSGRALMGETRRFLRWAENPLADRGYDGLWALPDGEAVNRRWATGEDAADMLRVATPRERAVIALLFLCGLRGVEATRLLVRNVTPDGPEPCLLVLGKGRNGGKWRKVPLSRLAWSYLKAWAEGKPGDAPVLPVPLRTVQTDVVRVARRAGLRLSSHDLRRGFGRTYWETNGKTWAAVLSLQEWYGHSRPETTVHYLGIRFEDMRAGIAPFEDHMRSLLDGAASELASREAVGEIR